MILSVSSKQFENGHLVNFMADAINCRADHNECQQIKTQTCSHIFDHCYQNNDVFIILIHQFRQFNLDSFEVETRLPQNVQL